MSLEMCDDDTHTIFYERFGDNIYSAVTKDCLLHTRGRFMVVSDFLFFYKF